ncbi:DUF6928 family protein [Sinosporangium siamense]|uniref:Uncharacterized protein n=1 Tax=Sinosporangium siamense TaxID=1367973 RepID=A0A919RE77_9ACTN|nr:hypothetical protein [Sinosporangium siamense]GII91175.1 hypothetical protein Ssi02_14060 [Sinosporangium siamense]
MGAKTGLLLRSTADAAEVFRTRPALDKDACRDLLPRLYPEATLTEMGDGDLGECAYPSEGLVYIGCYPGVEIIADRQVVVDLPSTLPSRFVAKDGRNTYLHAMHSVTDWLAMGVWHDGTLIRSLSVAPDSGVMEDIGDPLPFETPFWSGEHPVEQLDLEDDAYPLPFHPLELGEEALESFFGFRVEGYPTDIDPFDIPLMGFRVD